MRVSYIEYSQRKVQGTQTVHRGSDLEGRAGQRRAPSRTFEEWQRF